jgi:hypothetical protein
MVEIFTATRAQDVQFLAELIVTCLEPSSALTAKRTHQPFRLARGAEPDLQDFVSRVQKARPAPELLEVRTITLPSAFCTVFNHHKEG